MSTCLPCNTWVSIFFFRGKDEEGAQLLSVFSPSCWWTEPLLPSPGAPMQPGLNLAPLFLISWWHTGANHVSWPLQMKWLQTSTRLFVSLVLFIFSFFYLHPSRDLSVSLLIFWLIEKCILNMKRQDNTSNNNKARHKKEVNLSILLPLENNNNFKTCCSSSNNVINNILYNIYSYFLHTS